MAKFEAIRRCHFHPSKVRGQIFFFEIRVLQEPSNPSIYTVQWWGLLSQTLVINSHAELVPPLTIAGCEIQQTREGVF